jgi:5-carboxymethyl-2-hydroxymuconate isomerase
MSHLTIEYTSNIKLRADIPALLRKANQVILSQDGVFPPGGVRSRAIELTEYAMADGEEDYAFVHATFKIGAGRSEAQKTRVTTELFEMIKAHFAALFASRYLALSLELYEFSEAGTLKHNNVHARFKNK